MLAEYDTPAPEVAKKIYIPNELTTKFHIIDRPTPTYTDEARLSMENGTVRMRAIFGADGTISRVLVLDSLSPGLTANAVDALKRIQFTPGLLDGRPVSIYVLIEYNFTIL